MNNPAQISRFEGEYHFLSNFHEHDLHFGGRTYPSSEHIYQEAKSTVQSVREEIRNAATPLEAQRLGRKHENRPNWDEVKLPHMRRLVSVKFRDPVLAGRLLCTGDALLVEGNDRGDTFWGECDGVGENHMGRILMEVRADIRRHIAEPNAAAPGIVVNEVDYPLPTVFGDAKTIVYTDEAGTELEVQVHGEVAGREKVLVRVHSACFTGERFGSQLCDCGEQWEMSRRIVGEAGQGVLIYVNDHEGRGIGPINKLHAYNLQRTRGLDTMEANQALGLPVDARDYAAAAAILKDLGPASIELLTNNPAKQSELSRHGVVVASRAPVRVKPTAANHRYQSTKRDRMGHDLPHLPHPPQ